MSIYTNIGGGQKQLASLYINNNGSNKSLTNAYANINGTSKEIFTKLYTWAKYTWYYSNTKSYTLGGAGSPEESTVDTLSLFNVSAYRNLSFVEENNEVYYNLSNEVYISFSYSNTYLQYIDINNSRFYMSSYRDNSNHELMYGIQVKTDSANYVYFYFTQELYTDFLGDSTKREDPYRKTAISSGGYYTNISAYKEIYIDSVDESYRTTYQSYTPLTRYLWKPNPVEYVTSTDKNAYSVNHTGINVNSNYYDISNTYFSYNPTYRFIG